MKNINLLVLMVLDRLKKRFVFFLSLTVTYITVVMIKDVMKFALSDYAVAGIVMPIFYLGGCAAWVFFSVIEVVFFFCKRTKNEGF